VSAPGHGGAPPREPATWAPRVRLYLFDRYDAERPRETDDPAEPEGAERPQDLERPA
jgi:hypothetical protein